MHWITTLHGRLYYTRAMLGGGTAVVDMTTQTPRMTEMRSRRQGMVVGMGSGAAVHDTVDSAGAAAAEAVDE